MLLDVAQSKKQRWFAISFPYVLGGLVALACAHIVNGITHPVTWSLVFLVFIASVLPVVHDIQKGRFDVLEVKNLVVGYYLMQFGVWSIIVLVTEETKWPIPVDDTFNLALLYSVIGITF